MDRIRVCLFLCVVIFLIPSWSFGDSLPESIGPLKLVQRQSGEEARREIDEMHGKEIEFQRGYIGIYEDEHHGAKLWVSEYTSRKRAVEAVQSMARGVREAGEDVFWHYREISVEGLPVYFVVGMGQAHYFFQKGIKVVWLAIDPSIARSAIREVIAQIP